MTVHDFDECLSASHEADELPFWEECYTKAFHPYFASMVSHREDGFWQRAGVDRTIVLTTSKSYKVDEKVRFTDYGDVALEFLSNDVTNSPGWVCKPLQCDYIAYAIAPRGLCLLLPVVQLQQAWLSHGELWKQQYKICRAKNRTYRTLSVAVPIHVLFPAIGGALRIDFRPIETEGA